MTDMTEVVMPLMGGMHCTTLAILSVKLLTLNLLFSSAEMLKKYLWQTVWTQIRLLIGAVCSGSTLFASILNSTVMLDNYLQQTTSADELFRCIFFLAL